MENRKEIVPEAKEAPECRVVWLGSMEYRAAWDYQKRLAAQRLLGEIPDTLLLLEHPPTLTLGRGATAEHIVATPEILEAKGVAVIESDRGGDVTYHGPGQLVGYPILNLNAPPHRPDLHLYLRNIEEALIRTLAAFGIESGRFPGYTGVWVDDETKVRLKVAAIGVKSSRWITQHGFALNVSPDLSHFDLIVPCGIRDYGVTSLSRILGRSVAVDEVVPEVVRSFGDVFGLDCRL